MRRYHVTFEIEAPPEFDRVDLRQFIEDRLNWLEKVYPYRIGTIEVEPETDGEGY